MKSGCLILILDDPASETISNIHLLSISHTICNMLLQRPPKIKTYCSLSNYLGVPDAGKDLRQEEKGTTEDEMVDQHHRLNGHEFEQAFGVGDGQGGLADCSPWGHKESDSTEELN